MPEIKQPIKQLFSSAYNQASWKQFLGEAFAAQLLASPEVLTGIDAQVAAIAKMLGFINLDENGVERQIAVYEVTLAEGIILERNRVGLRNVLRKYWRDIDAALIVYHRPESRKWRLTYVSELRGFGADGESVEIKTEPKRYTYVLGEGETVRTAVSRFQKIQEKGRGVSLDDVKEAFSVEKLSKVFFDEYKKHYEAFCKYMLADPFSYQTIFKGDEKGIRDFSKKLLGRIVFLYFIQKKGWLGVKVGDAWGNGDFNFLTELFGRNQALFYEQLLSPLFFDTLNSKRADDVIELVAGEPCRIPYLNGGLFEEDDPQHRHLVFPVNLFENLFEFFNQYNFTIYEDDPNDHTVAVDPEMLGHIFENLLEDNKDKGAFYTPKEIVHYMCQESLIEYLTTWFENNGYKVVGFVTIAKPEQPSLFSENTVRESQLELEVPVEAESNTKQINRVLIEKLLKKTLSDDERLLVGGYADKFNVALDAVKICDPAIGSGAFPMGLLHEIFTAKQTLYGIVQGNANGFAASEVKLNIIQNSIYGVDIERGAVDIARLRFWLSLIVDESEPKPLPNLDYKIVVGNSLVSKLDDQVIDLDWNLDETAHGLFGQKFVKQKASLLCDVSDKQKQFFSPDSDKKKLAVDIRNLKIDLLINQLELMIKTRGEETKPTGTGKAVAKQTQIYLDTLGWKANIAQLRKLRAKPDGVLNFFDWKLDFPEIMNERVSDRVGFDIIVGNPPYFNIQTLGAKSLYVEQIKQKYSEIWMDKSDILFYFIKLGIEIAKTKGDLHYIISNAFLFSDKAQRLRNFILEKAAIQNIINFEKYSVFDSAMITTAIVNFKKGQTNKNIKSLTLQNESKKDFMSIVQDKNKFIEVNLKQDTVFALINNKSEKLNQKIDKDKSQLGQLVLVGKGMETAANSIFSNVEINSKNFPIELLKKRLDGKAIKKYIIDKKSSDNILYFEHIDEFESLPISIQKYLSNNKSILESRATVKNEGRAWWRYSRPMHKRYYNLDKIWTSYRSPYNCFAFDGSQEYIGLTNTTVIFNTNPNIVNLKYLLSLLNSKLLDYRYKSIGKQTGGGIFEYFENGVSKLPIAVISSSNQLHFINLTDKILQLKSEGKDTTALEQQIDNLVYKLYELTYQEVKAIDPEFKLTESEYEAIKIEV